MLMEAEIEAVRRLGQPAIGSRGSVGPVEHLARRGIEMNSSRVRVIELHTQHLEAARRFEVSPASAVRWHETFVQDGLTQAKPMGGDQPSPAVEAQTDVI